MVHLLDLPEELLVHIFRYLRGSTTLKDTLQVLTTCRQIHYVGAPILVEHVKVDDDTCVPFLWTLKANAALLTTVQSLTVEMHNEWPQIDNHPAARYLEQRVGYPDFGNQNDGTICSVKACCGGRIHNDAQSPGRNPTARKLRQLADAISAGLRMMICFSLIIDNEPNHSPWCRCTRAYLDPGLFSGIIRALPLTCTSLYLDTGFSDEMEGFVLEAALFERLPLLEALWFRAHGVGSGFFLPNGTVSDASTRTLEMEAFQMWSGNRSREFFWEENGWGGDNDWDMPDEQVINFEKWKQIDTVTRQQYVDAATFRRSNDQVLGHFNDITLPVYQKLRYLTVNRCGFPTISSVNSDSQDGDEMLPRLLARCTENGMFPALRSCIVFGSDFEPPDRQEYGLLRDDVLLDPHFHPVSTILVWDVAREQTHALRVLPAIREREFPEANVADFKIYLMRDDEGMLRHGSFNELLKLVDKRFSGWWTWSNVEGMVSCQTTAPDFIESVHFQGTESAEIIEVLAQRKAGLTFYLRAWLATPFMMNGISSRLELYWERRISSLYRSTLPASRYQELVRCYNAKVARLEKWSDKDLHPWLRQRLVISAADAANSVGVYLSDADVERLVGGLLEFESPFRGEDLIAEAEQEGLLSHEALQRLQEESDREEAFADLDHILLLRRSTNTDGVESANDIDPTPEEIQYINEASHDISRMMS